MDRPRLNGFVSLVLVSAVVFPFSTTMRSNPRLPLILRAEADLNTGLLTVSGQYFGTTADSVMLGGAALDVQSWTPEEITASLPSGITPGTYLLRAFAGKPSAFADMAITVGGQPGASRFIVGSLTGLPNLAQDVTMPTLVGATGSNTIVVASGWGDSGSGVGPITIQGQVTSPTTIHFTVHDKDGVLFDQAVWNSADIRYAVFLVE